jgi:HlyD family secretion protein
MVLIPRGAGVILRHVSNEAKPDGTAILALAKRRRLRNWLWRGAGLAAVAVAAAAFGWYRWGRSGKDQALTYVTVPAKLGDLRETVTATGTFKGLDSVDVGAQVSGRVTKVTVDINDQVTQGQVLAEIDPSQLKSRVDQSRAQVQASAASIRLAQTTATQAKATLARTKELNQKGLASAKELEQAQADADRSQASVSSAQAQATVSAASLKDAQTSLSFSTVVSPIDGIVLARSVEPGQTVAASLQAPVLFTLARDLTQLRLYVEIDEADIGKVREDQKASFTVDAWPNRRFPSEVVSVHNLPTAGQSVVTYQAVLVVDNQELLLRPGMTATATIITSEKKGLLLVPNAALRFSPPTAGSSKSGSSPLSVLQGGGMTRMPRGASSRGTAQAQSVVWTLEGGKPKRQLVEVGGNDGQWSEIKKNPAVNAGTPLVVDAEQRKQP